MREPISGDERQVVVIWVFSLPGGQNAGDTFGF
jgi:hypothetical protein